MMQLIKRDLRLNWQPQLFLIVIGVPFLFFITFPPIYTLWAIIYLPLAFNLFYNDHKAQIYQFLHGLPISPKHVIRSRFIYLFFISAVAMLYQWGVSILIIQFAEYPSTYFVYTWKDMIVVLSGVAIVTAVIIPFFHFIRSFNLSTIIIFVLFFSFVFVSSIALFSVMPDGGFTFNEIDQGYVKLVEAYIPFSPFITLSVISFTLFFLSMKLTEWRFVRQDH
ncbi:ABC-2 transporter permease [Lentibacillus saliphilus]|uniref:ABC-2 transporter permease n=1 Tax=Lentibacillus saliphilus TaxID=2737028 RepID=UPI001C2FA633|nr:ABC-2 transporter permease [Lentibacillus saliphilus]